MASLPVIAGQELDEGLEEMWLGSAQGVQAIDAGEFKNRCSLISVYAFLVLFAVVGVGRLRMGKNHQRQALDTRVVPRKTVLSEITI